MNREELSELHYITPISNVASIMQAGILCHKRAAKVPHPSVAMPEIQDRRRSKRVPGGLPLHQYVNLYFHARNPMLYKRKAQHADLCILRISTDVLELKGVVIADGNAASSYTAFYPSLAGLAMLDRELVFARYWTSSDIFEGWHRKRAICAEVLVPDRMDPSHIMGAYVSCPQAAQKLSSQVATLNVTINRYMFFLS